MHISIAAESLFTLWGVPITNSLLVAWAAILILVFFSWIATRNLEKVPSGAQNAFEAVADFLLDLMDGVTGGRERSLKFFPFICTIFLFVIMVNWMGLIPGAGSIGLMEKAADGGRELVPFVRASSADLNFTIGLAIISVEATI